MKCCVLLAWCSLLVGCSERKPDAFSESVVAMYSAIRDLNAKPEHDAARVKVRHILISFAGVEGIEGVTRTFSEAQTLAAEVWQRVVAGEDFAKTMAALSNDSGPGEYEMTTATRSGMVPGFGKVGWRLQVGEIGVAPFDATASPFGWHIIERVE